MEDRQSILTNIKVSQPALQELPSIPDFSSGIDLLTEFTSKLDLISVKWMVLQEQMTVGDVISSQYKGMATICSTVGGVASQITLNQDMKPHLLKDVDLTILRGEFGVAENGAIWVSEDNMVVRASAFITQHLVLLLSKDAIVETMHQAYKRIDLNQTDYGVFIAGPSKTADIEQVLVTGAHGPRSLMVILV